MRFKKMMVTAVLAAAVMVTFAGCGNQDAGSGTAQGTSSSTQTATSEQKKVQPTFMYFVSKSDANYDEAMAVVAELGEEYGERVKFRVLDVDENPEYKENYMINQEDSPMPRHTPTLIMLDTNNDICSMNLSNCTDKETLKAEIEKALSK